MFEPGEEMTIENVLIENVRCRSECWGAFSDFICLRPVVSRYMKTKAPGRINGVHFKNVTLDGKNKKGKYGIRIKGHREGYGVSNVKFENVSRFGEQLRANSPPVRIEGNTSDIVFK